MGKRERKFRVGKLKGGKRQKVKMEERDRPTEWEQRSKRRREVQR